MLSSSVVGEGPTVVFVHGTPSSSFEFRHVVDALGPEIRCLRVDHLGFGASPKPADGDYSLAAHAERFEAFLEREEVHDAVFVLHDIGTAIALPALLRRRERCRAVVLMNTFLWPATGPMSWVLRLYATRLGRWVYRTFNVSVGVLLPMAWGRRKPLTAELKAQYQAPLHTSDARRATAVVPGELVGETLKGMALQMTELGHWPVELVWGMADSLVGADALARWRAVLPTAPVHELDDVGHFVAEEAPEEVAAAVRRALQATQRRS